MTEYNFSYACNLHVERVREELTGFRMECMAEILPVRTNMRHVASTNVGDGFLYYEVAKQRMAGRQNFWGYEMPDWGSATKCRRVINRALGRVRGLQSAYCVMICPFIGKNATATLLTIRFSEIEPLRVKIEPVIANMMKRPADYRLQRRIVVQQIKMIPQALPA